MAKKVKRGSLNRQINERMKSMDCIGQSRHLAKEEAREELGYKNNRTVGIHSHRTFDAYKSTCKQFTMWAKDMDKGIRNIEDVREEHIKEFIKDRWQEGYSAYTYSKDLAGLNKVFNTHITKADCEVPNRSYKDISNNREMKEHHNHINYNNYQKEIDMVRATGMRRDNVTKITPNTFNYDDRGYPVSIRLVDERATGGDNWSEKGGRDRVSDIPYQLQERAKEIIDEHIKNGGAWDKPIFEHIPDRLGTHRFRQEYADMTYKNYVEEHGESKMYRGYDEKAIEYTSKQLGHNRLDVVVYSYLVK
jgi:hypothetical protein